MQKAHLAFFLCLCVAFCATPPAMAADPPASKPAEAEEVLSERQQSLLLQLADAEANIRALNAALSRTGYKVGQAYDRIDTNLKGNELMDRKGGGPVGWQEFYGRTARAFVMHDARSPVYVQVQRPRQFDYVYKANDDQINRATQQVAALKQDQQTLLARRQKHESDQSRLWAMLAWTRIADREIADEPICRFKLKSSAGASDAKPQVLRAVVLFLRTADQIAGDGLESVKTDQAGTFAYLEPRTKAAYAALRASLADSVGDLKSDDKKQADVLKALCKQLWDESSVVADNYRNALDRDQAKEDSSKLDFRGHLQTSLAKFSATVAELDHQVSELAATWGVGVEVGSPTADPLPQVVARTGGQAQQILAQRQENASADHFQVGAIFTDGQTRKLTILERSGETVGARYEYRPNIVRIVSGVVKDGTFSWLAKDVRAVQGGVGGNNIGTINGDQLDFQWHDDKGQSGVFTLRLDKSSVLPPLEGRSGDAIKTETKARAASTFDAANWQVWCWSPRIKRWEQYPLEKMKVQINDDGLTATNTADIQWPRAILIYRGAQFTGDFSISAEYRGQIESFDLQAADGQSGYVTCHGLPNDKQWRTVTMSRKGQRITAALSGATATTQSGGEGGVAHGYFCFKMRPNETVEIRNIKVQQMP